MKQFYVFMSVCAFILVVVFGLGSIVMYW